MGRMRILMDTALNKGEAEYDNMGDVAMLQVAVSRLKRLCPSATIEVLTESGFKLSYFCPDAKPVSRVGRDLWIHDHLLFGRYHQYLPSSLSTKLGEWRRSLWLRYPALHNAIVGLRLNLRGRDRDRKDLFEYLDALENADLFFVCGAGGFADSTRDWDMPVLSTLHAAIQKNIPTALMGQGMGPLSDPFVSRRMKEVLPKITMITLRGTRGGLELLQALGVDTTTVQTTGDDALELAYEARNEAVGNKIGINLRVATYSDVGRNSLEIIKPVLQQAAVKHNAQLIPVPIAFHAWANDHEAIKHLLAGHDDSSDGGVTLNTPLKVIQQVGRCRIVVTGAYHAAVFALAQGIPAVCLAKSPYYVAKFQGLEDQFKLGCETVNLNDAELQKKLTDSVNRAWLSAESVRQKLRDASLHQIKASRQAYERLKEFLPPRVRN